MTAYIGPAPEFKDKKECDDFYEFLKANHSIKITKREGFDLVFEDGIRIRQKTWQDRIYSEPQGPWQPLWWENALKTERVEP